METPVQHLDFILVDGSRLLLQIETVQSGDSSPGFGAAGNESIDDGNGPNGDASVLSPASGAPPARGLFGMNGLRPSPAAGWAEGLGARGL
jgi:hypothetical protein